MVTSGPHIGGAGGTLAVGSLCFLGAFMVVDGVTGLYLLIDQYAGDAAWAVLFAFPALVLSYVFGLIATTAGHVFFQRLRKRSAEDELEHFAQVAGTGNQAMAERYLALVQHQALLEGASVGFLMLAIGSMFSIRWLSGFEVFGVIAGLGFTGLAVLSPVLADKYHRDAVSLARLAVSPSARPRD